MKKDEFLKLGAQVGNQIKEKGLKEKLYLGDKSKGILDAVQEKMISRKLLVFICSTALLWNAQLDPETWGMFAKMLCGGQTAVDVAKMGRHGG
jgi:hypothetical protein